ncbi:transporter [Massilia niabensis]|uniref:Transporter n=1 Tax=Massilia niabensis TaxID=544910 RepID=A0ABW0L2L6_9BURK
MHHIAIPSLSLSRLAGAVTIALAALAPACAADEGIVTDRPDFVESSNVVGLGRLQVETSVAIDRSRSTTLRERVLSTPTLLRYGISDTVELRVESDGRVATRTHLPASGERSSEAGSADAALGLKWHLADAVGANPSLGVLVHVDTPSGSRALRGEKWRPSLRVVGEWELPNDMSLGLMPGAGSDTDDLGRRYTYGIFGAVLGKQLTDRLRGFVEIAAPHVARSSHGGTQATFDIGGAYLITDTLQVDTMLARGLNSRTPDLSLTVGLSFKL